MKLDLSGTWQFALDGEKAGIRQEFFRKTSFDDTISLPTTTAEAEKGEKGTERFVGHLTEPYHFEGYAWYLREVEIPETERGKRFFFSMERTRKSTVWVDGVPAGRFDSFYVEHRYELSAQLTPGKHTLVVMTDNTDYVSNGGHMTSPDTQTNWNGILGEILLESVEDISIDQMWIYPSRKEKNVDIRLRLSHDGALEDVRVSVCCRLTALRMKEGRDFEHFEPLHTQAAETRREWTAQGKGQDLPYVIETLEVLPEKVYALSDAETAQTGILQPAASGTCDGDREIGVLDTKMTLRYLLGEQAREWDEHEPYVYELTVRILREDSVLCGRTSYFGLRDLTHDGLTLYCNDREIFLRGTHDGMIFPLTGYAPMDLDSWLRVYGTSREYGLNHYRYHTCCPPKAAFLAASYLGIYVQAELAFWGSIYEAGDENYDRYKEQQEFLLAEGIRALDAFGDLPSYFGMSMGNELWGSREEINRIMGVLKAHDTRHLYTQGSNNHQFVPAVLPNDDFFSGVRFSKYRLFRGSYAMCDAPLGFVQTERPGAYWNYDEMISPAEIKKGETAKAGTIQIQYGTGIKEVEVGGGEEEVIPHVPVVSHEIGQYEFTPDFHEIDRYTGVLKPENMKIFRERMEEKGLLCYADDYFRASGKLAAACYKLELEAALRSANLSGFQLLDIKDFSGQGTALVGIMNAFHINKGAITRTDWRMFCSDAVLLPTLDSFVMRGGGCVRSEVKLRYYRTEGLANVQLKAAWHLKKQAAVDTEYRKDLAEGKPEHDKNENCQKSAVQSDVRLRETAVQTLDCADVTGRGLLTLGTMALNVPACENNAVYTLRFSLTSDNAEDIVNEYDIFVYEECKDTIKNAGAVYITNDNKAALEEWNRGSSVLLFVKPDSTLPDSHLKGEYCTDFWCYPMFRSISEGAGKPVPVGTMGLLIDTEHPALAGFACEEHTTAQWYQIVMHSRPMILDSIEETKDIRPIVRMMDNFERNHNLGLIHEITRGDAKMLVCEADLAALRKEYPEADCLYRSLVQYVQSDAFLKG